MPSIGKFSKYHLCGQFENLEKISSDKVNCCAFKIFRWISLYVNSILGRDVRNKRNRLMFYVSNSALITLEKFSKVAIFFKYFISYVNFWFISWKWAFHFTYDKSSDTWLKRGYIIGITFYLWRIGVYLPNFGTELPWKIKQKQKWTLGFLGQEETPQFRKTLADCTSLRLWISKIAQNHHNKIPYNFWQSHLLILAYKNSKMAKIAFLSNKW